MQIRITERELELKHVPVPFSEDIKALYHMRREIETSFRELKYSIGLTHFHSGKLDYIKQEIWDRLILYSFCEAMIP